MQVIGRDILHELPTAWLFALQNMHMIEGYVLIEVLATRLRFIDGPARLSHPPPRAARGLPPEDSPSTEGLVFLVNDLVGPYGEENDRLGWKIGLTETARPFFVGEKLLALFTDGKDDSEVFIDPLAPQPLKIVTFLFLEGFGVVVGALENGQNLLFDLLLHGTIGLDVISELLLVNRLVCHFFPKTSWWVRCPF